MLMPRPNSGDSDSSNVGEAWALGVFKASQVITLGH